MLVRIARISLAALLLMLLATESSQAQRPQRFRPSRPTVSPYLDLLRDSASPVPNYYSFVRTQQRQQAINRQQQALQLQQNATILQLQSGLLRAQATGPVSGTPSGFQNPGSRYSFQSPRGYYNSPQAGR